MDHSSPFTWSEGESLADMEKPERIKKLKKILKSKENGKLQRLEGIFYLGQKKRDTMLKMKK